MAEGFAKKYGGDKVEVCSAGSKPSGIVTPDAIKVMKEIGIDISDQSSKGFEMLPYNKFDCIVTMGCKDVCPYFPAKERNDWQIDDPKGKDIDFFRKVRDEISGRVKKLLADIEVAVK